MNKKESIFDNLLLLKLIDLGKADDDLILSFGIVRNINGMYEHYKDTNSTDEYELYRESKFTKGILTITDKYNRRVKKYYINAERRRYQQYIDAYYKYNKTV